MEGPKVKGHPCFEIIYDHCKDQFDAFGGVGRVYEDDDKLGGFWAVLPRDMIEKDAVIRAWEIREKGNKIIGFPIMSKPEYHDSSSDANPYVRPAICWALLPKDVAEKSEKYGGDAMLCALAECAKSGIKIHL